MRALRIFVFLLGSVTVRAELAIVQARLQTYEDGPGTPATHVFKSGQSVFLSFNLSGYGRTSDEDAPKMNVAYRIEAADSKGSPIALPKSGAVEATLAIEDKNWLPKVRHQFVLPETPADGAHQVSISAKDQVSGEEARYTLTFLVEALQVEAISSLGIVNFKWDKASVRPGDAFEARYMISGYQLGEKNAYHVRYGVAFVDEAGKPVFSETNAAALKGDSFYPRRFLPAAMSLRLDAKVKPGRYRLRIDLEDLLGGVKASHEFPIQVAN